MVSHSFLFAVCGQFGANPAAQGRVYCMAWLTVQSLEVRTRGKELSEDVNTKLPSLEVEYFDWNSLVALTLRP